MALSITWLPVLQQQEQQAPVGGQLPFHKGSTTSGAY